MSTSETDPDLADRVRWMAGPRKAFYQANGIWAYGASQQLDLLSLAVMFSHLTPLKFMLELSGECIAMRIFDDVCTIGINQVTDESWTFIRALKADHQQRALSQLQLATATSPSVEKEQANAGQLH